MVQILSILFFSFLDFFNFCWVIQKFPFLLCHPVLTAAVEVVISSACFSCGGRGSSGYTVSSCGNSGATIMELERETVKLTFRHSLPQYTSTVLQERRKIAVCRQTGQPALDMFPFQRLYSYCKYVG